MSGLRKIAQRAADSVRAAARRAAALAAFEAARFRGASASVAGELRAHPLAHLLGLRRAPKKAGRHPSVTRDANVTSRQAAPLGVNRAPADAVGGRRLNTSYSKPPAKASPAALAERQRIASIVTHAVNCGAVHLGLAYACRTDMSAAAAIETISQVQALRTSRWLNPGREAL